MNQPSPCPQCHSDRVWARAALGAYGITHVAFCPGCARAATLCGRCGGELVLSRQSSWPVSGRPRVETVLHCPSCRQTAVSIPGHATEPPRPGIPAAPAGGRFGIGNGAAAVRDDPARSATGLLAPASPVLQRSADDAENQMAARYIRRREMVGVLEEAARRADALARLEQELQRLDTLLDDEG
jgi:hypothetical protein